MAAFNACITVGYVAGASVRGITLKSLEIRTRGELDLRGFLGLSDDVPPGYEEIDYEVRIHRRRHAGAIRGDPPERPQDLAQLLQRQPARPRERDAAGQLHNPGEHPCYERSFLQSPQLPPQPSPRQRPRTPMRSPSSAGPPRISATATSTCIANRSTTARRPIRRAAEMICDGDSNLLLFSSPTSTSYRAAVADGVSQMRALGTR